MKREISEYILEALLKKEDFILEENIQSIINTFHAIDHNKGMDDEIAYWKIIMKENCGLKDIELVRKIEQVPIAKLDED